MTTADKEQFVRLMASKLQIRWTTHALSEIAADRMTVSDVEQALTRAVVIENYAHTHRHLPDCLILSFDSNILPVHAVIALNDSQGYLLVVTVYRPNAQEWQNDWRTRK